MLYLITDTHLGHQNMLKSCGRPARFTNLILDSCRKMVRSNDTLIHLGDVAWNEEELIRSWCAAITTRSRRRTTWKLALISLLTR